MSNSDEPDRKPPPQETVAWDPEDVPGLSGEGRSAGGAPDDDGGTTAGDDPPPEDPGATVMFTAEDVEKLKEEQAAAAAAEADDRLIGTLIRDKWRVQEKLGAGSFGTVYKVQDVKGGWIEALKILGVDRMTGSEAEEMRARFLREAQIMKRLGGDSQHIVGLSTYEEDIEAGLIYFLMEFVEGRSLADALAEDGPFTVERTVNLALQVCDALMAAHEGPEPVVHRDLKLENLMLTTGRSGEEVVKVLDFGIAKIAERDADSRLTTVGTLGTPGYAAPEQLRAEEVDGRTDLFAFGVILYALLTGRDPWLGNLAHEPTHQIYELMVATDRAEVRPMGDATSTIPPEMVNVVMKLLRRDPAQRFQSARELRDTLRRLERGEQPMSDVVAAAPGGQAGSTAQTSAAAPSPASGTGTLQVLTPEPGVRVEVRDGRNVVAEGPTPCRADGIPAGSYTVEVRDPRFELTQTTVSLAAGTAQDVSLSPQRRTPKAPPRPGRKKSRKGRMALAMIVLASATAVAWARPWGRTLDRQALASHVTSGAVDRVYVTDGGLEGGLQIVPIDALQDLRMPFFVPVEEGQIPEAARELRSRGVDVDVSWEERRLVDLAADAQRTSRYYGAEGRDVRSYAQRLAELSPDSPEAASLLFKVGERMAWDAEAALAEGAAGEARQLLDRCLDLDPDQPRCLQVAEAL